jgi:hypothetical protein
LEFVMLRVKCRRKHRRLPMINGRPLYTPLSQRHAWRARREDTVRNKLKAWITPSPELRDELQPLPPAEGELEAKFNAWRADKKMVVGGAVPVSSEAKVNGWRAPCGGGPLWLSDELQPLRLSDDDPRRSQLLGDPSTGGTAAR